jgi:RNA polymerase sigma factor (sigma-70 family)
MIADIYIETEKMLKFAISLVRNAEYAKDLIQDTRLKAIQNYDKFDEGSNIRAWLYTIMRNEYINQYRRNSKRHNVVNIQSNHVFDALTTHCHNDGEFNLFLDEIKRCNGITENQLALLLKLDEGYQYEELSEYFDITLGTIKSRIHKARKKLKHLYGTV